MIFTGGMGFQYRVLPAFRKQALPSGIPRPSTATLSAGASNHWNMMRKRFPMIGKGASFAALPPP
jgi:hypothetical protein